MNTRAVTVATVAIALVLGAGEALLRALDWPAFDACDTTADYAIADPRLGFRGAPGAEVAGVRLNAHGWRGPALSRDKPPGEKRVLFLGDSTAWGLGVDLDSSFAGGATSRIPGAQLLLGAFPGYSSYQSRLVLEELLPFGPDVVIFYVGARNDGVRARYYADAEIPVRRARLEAGWHEIRLLRLVEAAVDRSYRSLFRKLRSRESKARVPPEIFRDNMDAMLSRLRDRRIPALVVIPPLSEAFAAEEPQMRGYREILHEVARGHGAPIVSVDDAFATRNESSLYFEDHFHLAAPGHAIVGDAIHDAIEREGWLR
jgi:lysophospholipase L1-like esterase